MCTVQGASTCAAQFKELSRACIGAKDGEVLVRLQAQYDRTNPHFLWSTDFIDLVNEYSVKICARSAGKLLHIQQFINALANYK